MAEKRRLPPRERREPAKKRLSEATPAPTPPAQKKKATPKVRPPPPELEKPLPTKIKDSDSLPIIRTRQPTTLSDKEYQSLADRFVSLLSCPSVQSLTRAFCQCCAPRISRTVQEEMAQRWDPRSLLYQTQEDQARTDRAAQPAQGIHDKGRTMRRHRRTPSFRCDDIHRQRSQRAADAVRAAAAPNGPLRPSRQLPTVPAILPSVRLPTETASILTSPCQSSTTGTSDQSRASIPATATVIASGRTATTAAKRAARQTKP